MGCDGGTIPKRDELVKTKKKPEQKDKAADQAFKWRHCSISQEALVQPIMACELGRLYNKESVLEFLLDRSKFECAASFEHLRGLKDVKELKLTDNPAAKDSKSAEKGDGYIDMQVADYICPVASIEMNGTYKFCFLWTCGCALSDRALKEIKAENCHNCGKPFTDADVVIMNPIDSDVTEDQYKMDNRRLLAKLAKKSKKGSKRSAAAETATSADSSAGPSQKKLCPEPSTSGASGTSKLTNGASDHRPKLTNGVGPHRSKLANGSAGDSKLTNGDSKLAKNGEKKDGKKSIQNDPKASAVYKSLFSTCDLAKRQTQGPWVTYNPQYF